MPLLIFKMLLKSPLFDKVKNKTKPYDIFKQEVIYNKRQKHRETQLPLKTGKYSPLRN